MCKESQKKKVLFYYSHHFAGGLSKKVQGLFRRYTRYIHLKTEEDDAALAEALTGYPAEKDEIFAKI